MRRSSKRRGAELRPRSLDEFPGRSYPTRTGGWFPHRSLGADRERAIADAAVAGLARCAEHALLEARAPAAARPLFERVLRSDVGADAVRESAALNLASCHAAAEAWDAAEAVLADVETKAAAAGRARAPARGLFSSRALAASKISGRPGPIPWSPGTVVTGARRARVS